MLAQIVIENLVVIEKAAVEFDDGLNVLTGQTGAGKSLLIGAIEALLGLRSTRDMLRSGATEGRLTGLFLLRDPAMRQSVATLLADPEIGEDLVIARRIQPTRSVATVNGRPVAASTLRDLAERLIDIHGQYEHQYLLRPQHQLDVLTAYADATDLAGRVREAYSQWQQLRSRAEQLAQDHRQRAQQIELYRFQLDEIDRVAPTQAEYEELQAEHRKLANLEKLRSLAAQALEALSERELSALEMVRTIAGALTDMARMDASAQNMQKACDEALASLDDLAIDLARYADSLDLDPARLQTVEQRIEQIRLLIRKYGLTVDDVLDYRARIGKELDGLEAVETDASLLDEKIAAAHKSFMDQALKLRSKRRSSSRKLAQAVMAELAELGMEKAVCTIELGESEPGPSGIDSVEFMISANPGQPPRPLRHVASGGELSRVMLALKSVLSGDTRCSILVFDEVDANVGGRMGAVIGRKLSALSRRNQVLCITHLPQIAAYADRHMTVQKSSDARTTRTEVTLLTDDRQRIGELAEMIAGKKITQTTTRQAEQLLQEARAERQSAGKARTSTKAAR